MLNKRQRKKALPHEGGFQDTLVQAPSLQQK